MTSPSALAFVTSGDLEWIIEGPRTQFDLPAVCLSSPGGSLQQGGGEDQLPHQPRQPHPHVLRPPVGLPHL